MEHSSLVTSKQSPPEDPPSLLKHITSETIGGFDNVECGSNLSCQAHPATIPSPCAVSACSKRPEITSSKSKRTDSDLPYSVFISMPVSPSGLHIHQTKSLMSSDQPGTGRDKQQIYPVDSTVINIGLSEQGKVLAHSITVGTPCNTVFTEGKAPDSLNSPRKIPENDRLKDKRYDSFKTWSGKLERQLSNFRGKPQEPDMKASNSSQIIPAESAPEVDRYFDALEGPELDTLRASETLVLPEDKKWPFLLRFPVSAFGMCLGVSSQAILWKTLATASSMRFLHVSLTVNLALWCISLALMGFVSFIYTLKIIFYFEAVKREYHHPVRSNFFFAPWIACLFLASGVPPSVATSLPQPLWYVLMAPILCLELKIYGQWMSGGQRRLSKVANPSMHLSIVGNFVGALLGASMGLKEGPLFFFAVGFAHYTVLFVTLYQRLPTNETLPKELHPVFFLFVAAPSVACMAWAKISGEFNHGAKIIYFVAMFLYVSLAVRINFFRGFKFSLAWWAYTFPMTGASMATIKYTDQVQNGLTQSLSVALSSISSFTVSVLLLYTIYHAFVLKDLFPNDISIAIAGKRPKSRKKLKRTHLKSMSSNTSDLEVSVSSESTGH